MVKKYGDPTSRRLFSTSDYIDPIIKRWCEDAYKNRQA